MAKASTYSILALIGVWLVSCGQPPTEPVLRERFPAMGTWVDIAATVSEGTEPRAALREIEAMLRTFERDYHPWSDGELAALNAELAAGRRFRASADLAALLTRAKRLSSRSRGLFEPGLKSLVELWGFHDGGESDGPPPSVAAITRLLAKSAGIEALRISNRMIGGDSSLTLDLGGIAKGAAVEKALSLLRERGVENALVNAGGDLAVLGRPPGAAARSWRIGIRHPRERGLLGVVELEHGEAAFTSGDYERFYDYQGRRMHHLLDPDTGKPVTHTQALTVVSRDPVLADAAATALFVAGPRRWREIARELGVDLVLRIGAGGGIEVTDAMSTRLGSKQSDHDILLGAP